ncbi:hypothetical protein HY212_00590 [Candidatus Pacearchaeota archaeon]|nr:hypothetical protein [Candidatus Pacearchaeota archaeon]
MFTIIIASVVVTPLSVSPSFLSNAYAEKTESGFESESNITIIINQLNHPSGVAVDKTGNIYVADTNNDRIEVFDSSGKLLKSFGSTGSGVGC